MLRFYGVLRYLRSIDVTFLYGVLRYFRLIDVKFLNMGCYGT